MAIGAYTFAICTVPIYPFQIGFWPGLGVAIMVGAVAGTILALPAMRLRQDQDDRQQGMWPKTGDYFNGRMV